MTEKFRIEALLDPDLAVDGFLKYVWKNMVTEGSEEGASNLINSFADILISGNQSQWAQNVEYYKSQGYSDSAARERALGDQAHNLGLDVLGGMLTGGLLAGGFLSGGYGGVSYVSSRGDSRIARGNGNAVHAAQSNIIQSLATAAHTPQERLTLDRYKSAVSLLENRRAILLKTQQQLQQLVATGRTGSAEYNKLKSAEITLSRKVDEAQRKVESAEDSASVKGLREKAKEQTTDVDEQKVKGYNEFPKNEYIMPNYSNAVTPIEKFLKYSLDYTNKNAVGKAEAYEKGLGYTKNNADGLINQIHTAVISGKTRPFQQSASEYGLKYKYRIPVTGPNGKTKNVIVVYQVDNGSITPRLITNYLEGK